MHRCARTRRSGVVAASGAAAPRRCPLLRPQVAARGRRVIPRMGTRGLEVMDGDDSVNMSQYSRYLF